jgi:hypothetical protein
MRINTMKKVAAAVSLAAALASGCLAVAAVDSHPAAARPAAVAGGGAAPAVAPTPAATASPADDSNDPWD